MKISMPCFHIRFIYLEFLSYTKVLEILLSAALFVQFGVSGVILCICAYQIAKVFE